MRRLRPPHFGLSDRSDASAMESEHSSARRSTLSDSAASAVASVRSTLSSLSSRASQAASAASHLGFSRPSSVEQPLCASRLSASLAALPVGTEKYTAAAETLKELKDVKPADQWWSEQPFGATVTFPAELAGQTIGTLTVKWPDPPTMTAQRRYASTRSAFKLSRAPRAAATFGLYVDGDLVGSELLGFQHACHESRIVCDELDEHLEQREAQLIEVRFDHKCGCM